MPHSISKDSAVPLTQHAANAARMHTPGAEQLHVNGSWRLRAGALTVRVCSDAGLSRAALWHNMVCTVLVPGIGASLASQVGLQWSVLLEML